MNGIFWGFINIFSKSFQFLFPFRSIDIFISDYYNDHWFKQIFHFISPKHTIWLSFTNKLNSVLTITELNFDISFIKLILPWKNYPFDKTSNLLVDSNIFAMIRFEGGLKNDVSIAHKFDFVFEVILWNFVGENINFFIKFGKWKLLLSSYVIEVWRVVDFNSVIYVMNVDIDDFLDLLSDSLFTLLKLLLCSTHGGNFQFIENNFDFTRIFKSYLFDFLFKVREYDKHHFNWLRDLLFKNWLFLFLVNFWFIWEIK